MKDNKTKITAEEAESWICEQGPDAESLYGEDITTGLIAGAGLTTMAAENYAQVESNLLDYNTTLLEYNTSFAPVEMEWAPNDNPLKLYHQPENLMMAEFTGDHHFIMYNDDGEFLVDVNLSEGDTTFGPNYSPDEAARVFWETVGKVQVAPAEEEYMQMSAPPGIADDMPDYSSETLSAMLDYPEETKVEVLPGGEALGELEDIQYFRDKLARAMELKQIPLVDKLEKQIALLEDSVVVYKEQRPSDIDIFDKSMEGLIDG